MRATSRLALRGGIVAALAIVLVGSAVIVFRVHAHPGYTVAPNAFRSGSYAKWVDGAGEGGEQGLVLTKSVPTTVVTAATAAITGVDGLSTGSLTLGFDTLAGSYCGAGAPRFNVTVSKPDGSRQTYFLGCIYGAQVGGAPAGWQRYVFTLSASGCTGEFYEGCPPAGSTVHSIGIVLDEQGTATLDMIRVNDTYITSRGNSNNAG